MSHLTLAIQDIVRASLSEQLAMFNSGPPVLISVDDAKEICRCDKSVIKALIADAASNGFPVIRLGQRTIKIDQARLYAWLNAGGIPHGEHHEEEQRQVSRPHLKAVERAA